MIRTHLWLTSRGAVRGSAEYPGPASLGSLLPEADFRLVALEGLVRLTAHLLEDGHLLGVAVALRIVVVYTGHYCVAEGVRARQQSLQALPLARVQLLTWLRLALCTVLGTLELLLGPNLRIHKGQDQDLVFPAVAAFQQKRLRIARGVEDKDALVNELRNYKRTTNIATGNMAFEPWREADHDDLLFAVALSLWGWQHGPRGSTRLRAYR